MGHETLANVLAGEGTAVVPYLTGGFPDLEGFTNLIDSLLDVAPAIEVGLPFSDPMADGATIQESSRLALAGGATVDLVVAAMERRANSSKPIIVMSYLNPLLAYGLDDLMPRLSAAGVRALVIPDLPMEESEVLGDAARKEGIGVVQMVTPITSEERLHLLCAKSQGFVYAVTMTGTTGSEMRDEDAIADYLGRVRSIASVPVLAGFGVRSRSQVERLGRTCDGVIVGSAIIECISNGEDPVQLLKELSA